MMMKSSILCLALLALSCTIAIAFDPSNLQDFCVADKNSKALVNGAACLDPSKVQVESFTISGLHLVGNTSNNLGFAITPVTVAQLPGLNTLGISMVRFDYAPGGMSPIHLHPRASEIITVIHGTIEVAFITSAPDQKLFTKVLQKGDVFVFPIGLIHYQRNIGNQNAVTISGLNGQNPGAVFVANTVFGSNPPIAADALAKAFQIDQSVVDNLQTIF